MFVSGTIQQFKVQSGSRSLHRQQHIDAVCTPRQAAHLGADGAVGRAQNRQNLNTQKPKAELTVGVREK